MSLAPPDRTQIPKVDDVGVSSSESGSAAGVLISLSGGNVTEPPTPPPQLPTQILPPVLRNIVNNEPIVQPDAHTASTDVMGVSNRITKDFFQLPHPHALSKELVFEILTSGACAPEAPIHNSASPIDRRINFFYVTSAKSPGNLGVEDSENEISVSFQSIANSGPWWSQYTHDGKRFGIVTRHMSRRSRVQGRTGLHQLAVGQQGGRSNSGDNARPQDELHGFQGRWFCLVSAPIHLIGDKPAKMKMAKAVPGALSLVQIWDASANDSLSARRGKRKRIEGAAVPAGVRPGYNPTSYGWPSMPMDGSFPRQGQFDGRQGNDLSVEQGGHSWRSRVETYSKPLDDEDAFSDREDNEEEGSDDEHRGTLSNMPSILPTRQINQQWNQQYPPYQQLYDPSMRAMSGTNYMQPPTQHRWMNPFQQQQQQRGGGEQGNGGGGGGGYSPSYSNNPSYDQRFMNHAGGGGGQNELVIGLQCQVQSLMRAVNQLQTQLANQNQHQLSHHQTQPYRQPEQHGMARSNSRSNSTSSDHRKSPDRWGERMHSYQDIGQGVSGTNGNAGSFDTSFNSSNSSFPNTMMSSVPLNGTSYSLSNSIDIGTHSFDTSIPFAAPLVHSADSPLPSSVPPPVPPSAASGAAPTTAPTTATNGGGGGDSSLAYNENPVLKKQEVSIKDEKLSSQVSDDSFNPRKSPSASVAVEDTSSNSK